jgi:hypothetical protein
LDVNTTTEKLKAISEGKNPDLLINTENIAIWKSNAVIKAADHGIDHKLEERH